MKSLYAKQRKKTTDKFSLASTKIDTRAEKVEASEAVRSIAEKVEHFIVSLQKISISSDYFLERVMGRLAVSENRNLEKIALLATTTTELDTRVLLFRSIYEELRKRIIYNILLITKAYSSAEMISCSEVTRTLAEEIGSLIISLQERPISSADFAQEVMALITTSENQYLDKIASVASTSQINLIELISSTSKLRSIYKELRQTIIEILSQKATETGISEESEEVARAVAEEIGSLIVDLQDDSTTSHGSRQRHSERIAVFENQLLEKIMLMKVDGQPYEMKFALRLWQSRRTYESLRGNLKEFPTQGI
ncbi:hypothetical protein TNCT_530882 [Trichonephila clavata]|nr:hypothetical protein TNCT_530882 [Trichonephila clavata]